MPSATHGWMGNANWWANKAKTDWEARDKAVKVELKFSGNVNQQVADIEDLLVKKVDALVVFPHDTSVTSIVEKAFNPGVYVVVLDRGVSKEGIYDIYITNDDEAYTRKGMEWLAEQMGYKGNLLLITGIPCPIDTIRTDTIKEVVKKYPNIKLLDVQPGDWNQQKSLTVMENYLQKYKQIDAVYTADDDMMLGAMQAYKESGRKDIKVLPRRRHPQDRGQGDHGQFQSPREGGRHLFSLGHRDLHLLRGHRGQGREAQSERLPGPRPSAPDHPALRARDPRERQGLLRPRGAVLRAAA